MKKVTQMIETGIANECIFNDILSLGKKWQTAFGLRLRGRIGVRASCFYSLSLHCCPLFFQCFFDVFWGHPGTQNSAIFEGRRHSLHPVICLQEQSPCVLVPRNLDGDFYRQPGGLVPRARGRIYVAFGEHPAAGGFLLEVRSHWVQP